MIVIDKPTPAEAIWTGLLEQVTTDMQWTIAMIARRDPLTHERVIPPLEGQVPLILIATAPPPVAGTRRLLQQIQTLALSADAEIVCVTNPVITLPRAELERHAGGGRNERLLPETIAAAQAGRGVRAISSRLETAHAADMRLALRPFRTDQLVGDTFDGDWIDLGFWPQRSYLLPRSSVAFSDHELAGLARKAAEELGSAILNTDADFCRTVQEKCERERARGGN